MKKEVYDIECKVIGMTDRAVRVDFGDKKEWLPLSQIEVERGNPDIITVPAWLIEEKELEGYV